MYGLEDIVCCRRDSSYDEEEYLASGQSCSPTVMYKDCWDVVDDDKSPRLLTLRGEQNKSAAYHDEPSMNIATRSPCMTICIPSQRIYSPYPRDLFFFAILDDWATALYADHVEDVVHGNLTPKSVGIAHGRGTLRDPRQGWFRSRHAVEEHLKGTHGNLTRKSLGVVHGREILRSHYQGWLPDQQVFRTREPLDDDVHGARWAATELFRIDSDNINPTKMSDVYSFACIMLQMLTGEVPYCGTKRPEQVVYLKFLGREPIDAQTPQVADRHVAFMRWCWSPEPEKRPTMETVVRHIREERTRGT